MRGVECAANRLLLSLADPAKIAPATLRALGVRAIAQPGAGNIQPRFDGAAAVLGSAYNVVEINTTTDTSAEQSKMTAWLLGNKDAKGLLAVDYGSTSYLAGALKAAGVKAEIFRYAAKHGFMNEQRPDAHQRQAAELAWSRTIAFIASHLG